MNPLASVIVPLYNCGEYIEKCMTSILKQSYRHIEAIVINDGSTDNSDQIMRHFAGQDPRIKYMFQSNHGVAHARNAALQAAAGNYILFVDADDYIGIHYIRDMIECAEKNGSDLVIAGFTMEDEGGKNRTVLLPQNYERFHNEVWAYRLSACCGRMYRRDFWDKYQIQFVQEEGARAEDIPITLFANAMAGNIAVVSSAEYYYVQHMSSAMHNREQKVPFLFPYTAFRMMYNKVAECKPYNSKPFFNMGILKFLAQFEFVIYRRASRAEKKRFRLYVQQLLQDDYAEMADSWKQIRRTCGLPLSHKAAIDLFVLKYKVLYARQIG